MSEHSGSDAGRVESNTTAAVEIEFEGRWEALALAEHLVPFHSFLVQYNARRWVVHAQAPGCRGEDLGAALQSIDEWVAERGLGDISCRVSGRQHQLAGSERK